MKLSAFMCAAKSPLGKSKTSSILSQMALITLSPIPVPKVVLMSLKAWMSMEMIDPRTFAEMSSFLNLM